MDGLSLFHGIDFPIHLNLRKQHAIGSLGDIILVQINANHSSVTTQIQFVLLIHIRKGIWCQSETQTFSGIQQFVAELTARQEFLLVNHIDSCRTEHKQFTVVSLNDIKVIVIRKIVQNTDATILLRVAQSVRCYNKQTVIIRIGDNLQNDI